MAAVPVAFKDVGQVVDDDDTGMIEIPQSYCMACGESGTTRMIMIKIPFFREVIVSSFECDICGWSNNEVQFGGEIKEQGCRYELKVTDPKDLNRSVIKSDNGAIFVPELELEIPAKTQRGSVNTIEGVFQAAIDGLKAEQDYRREVAPEVAAKVDDIISRMSMVLTGAELPFTFIIDDPAGNSFVENPLAPAPDPQLKVTYYDRTPTQDMEVGLQPTEAAKASGHIDDTLPEHRSKAPKPFEGIDRLIAAGRAVGGGGGNGGKRKEEGREASKATAGGEGGAGDGEEQGDALGRSEAILFPQDCPSCHHPGQAVNCVTDIPYFKEVLIMAFTCCECGYRNSEIKGGGAIPTEGTLVRLQIENKDEDFSRDVLKSDTAAVIIPEIDLEITHGSLGGFFTSVEGLLKKIQDHLKEGNPFGSGDSATQHHLDPTSEEVSLQKKWREFMGKLDDIVEGRTLPVTIELRDPLGNSFIRFLGESPEEDKRLTVESYQRSWDEDEHLGLHDLATEGYETGYEGKYQEKIESDLKSRPHIHGGDHPTPFARGCVDDASKEGPEAVFTTATLVPNSSSAASDEVEVGRGEAKGRNEAATAAANGGGKGGEEEGVVVGDDQGRKFEAVEVFQGARPGWVYKLGAKGLGYYEDR